MQFRVSIRSSGSIHAVQGAVLGVYYTCSSGCLYMCPYTCSSGCLYMQFWVSIYGMQFWVSIHKIMQFRVSACIQCLLQQVTTSSIVYLIKQPSGQA